MISVDFQNPVRDFRCTTCGNLLLEFGSFNLQHPEFKELRIHKVINEKGNYRIRIEKMWNPRLRKTIGFKVPHCECSVCGHDNNFAFLLRDENKLTIKE